jgi:A/G-specific adenine glycosylase
MLEAAAGLLDPERPGDSNQALMELGATVCSPRRPRCLLCPISPGCRAARESDPELFPVARPKRDRELHRLAVAVVERNGGILLFRRPGDSTLMAGLWELPWAAAEQAEKGLSERYGGRWSLGERLGGVRHSITYRDLELDVHLARLGRGKTRPEIESGWFGERERAGLPLSSLVSKVLRVLDRSGGASGG